MYNNLMNRFQEYRRDRVVNQVQPQLSRQPVQSTSSWDPVAGEAKQNFKRSNKI